MAGHLRRAEDRDAAEDWLTALKRAFLDSTNVAGGQLKRHHQRKYVLQVAAFAFAIAAALFLLLVPGYSEVSQSNDGPEQVRTSTLLETIGPGVLLPLLVSVSLTGLPLLLRGRPQRYASIAAAIALSIFAVLGSLSIGWFFLPATIVAFIALFSPSEKPNAPRTHPELSH
ncbi:hypothetical protein [Paeniglutamicibacter kerguelensis]